MKLLEDKYFDIEETIEDKSIDIFDSIMDNVRFIISNVFTKFNDLLTK